MRRPRLNLEIQLEKSRKYIVRKIFNTEPLVAQAQLMAKEKSAQASHNADQPHSPQILSQDKVNIFIQSCL